MCVVSLRFVELTLLVFHSFLKNKRALHLHDPLKKQKARIIPFDYIDASRAKHDLAGGGRIELPTERLECSVIPLN